jgi:hypothetical protein
MSTRIGVLAEGPIDHALISPIIRQIATKRAQFTWPVDPADAAEWLKLRPRGHGGVWLAVQKAIRVLQEEEFPYSFIIILLDRRTKAIQGKIRRLISGRDRFVLAVAQEEIEAWWLGDRPCTLSWLRFDAAPGNTRYAKPGYQAERDKEPKKTLTELTQESPNPEIDRNYGEGNLDLARDFADFWEGRVNLPEIEGQCPKRFQPFCHDTTEAFRRAKTSEGRLL